MQQAELTSIGSELAILAFCRYAGDDLERWKLLKGQSVSHVAHGPGTIVECWKGLSSIKLKIAFDHVIRDFPESFGLREISGMAKHWQFEFPDDVLIPDDIVYAVMEQLEAELEENEQRMLADLQREQELDRQADQIRIQNEKTQREWDEAFSTLRKSVDEIYYICHVANLGSILRLGILSHDEAMKLPNQPRSIAMEEVQSLRSNRYALGRKLHNYVNFYFNPRNPMMSKRRNCHHELCVLGIDGSVLDHPHVVISDGNAANWPTEFRPAPDGLMYVDWDVVDSDGWVDFGNFEYARYSYRKRAIMAEVLVPNVVDSNCIRRIYVSGPTGRRSVQSILISANQTVDVLECPFLFFR